MPRSLLALPLLLILVPTASAQSIRWRADYDTAVTEARQTGRPLLLDFGTENCVWCRKQDATTLRDSNIVSRLNASFVPVKIDGDRFPKLAAAIGVQAYPTLVLAGPDGKILDRHTGYASAQQLAALLDKAEKAAKPVASELAKANAAFAAGRYAECLRLCKQIQDTKSADAPAARRLSESVSADPAKWRTAGEQIDAGLNALHAELATALR